MGSTVEEGSTHIFSPPEHPTLHFLFKLAFPHQGIFMPRRIGLEHPFNEDYKMVRLQPNCLYQT